jgi:hypothetical protein
MNSKYLAILLIFFGVLFTLAHCRGLAERQQGDDDDGENGNDGSDSSNSGEAPNPPGRKEFSLI